MLPQSVTALPLHTVMRFALTDAAATYAVPQFSRCAPGNSPRFRKPRRDKTARGRSAQDADQARLRDAELITVVVGSLAGGMTFEDVQREYGVTADDIRAALRFVGELAEPEFPQIPAPD